MICNKSDENSAELAADCLKKGEIVIIPTDTVYGFSGIADLKNGNLFKTDEKIRTIKGRSEGKPFIHLIAKPEDVFLYTDDKIPEKILALWPGPLTVIVHSKKDIPLNSAAETVAFRCPGDKWLRSVIEKAGAPVYSTSVNRSGSPVLENISEIREEFGLEVSLIVESHDVKGNVPSTIVSVDEKGIVKVVRQGAVKV
ncbi:MAG: L-threonylcarbamoyladenylate synthase [Treponema sp.]|nr:L-threonylcarbamoyladenylate synthase [Treponema sp.]